MQLCSPDGASVELRITGYEFPEDSPSTRLSELDANWLQVHGSITLADGRCQKPQVKVQI